MRKRNMRSREKEIYVQFFSCRSWEIKGAVICYPLNPNQTYLNLVKFVKKHSNVSNPKQTYYQDINNVKFNRTVINIIIFSIKSNDL